MPPGLSIRHPAGPFLLSKADRRTLVLFAAGAGIAPFVSLLRQAAVADPARDTTLVLPADAPEAVPFRAELAEITAQHPRARVVFEAGRVGVDLLLRMTGGPARALYGIGGPPPMIEGIQRLLAALGVPEDQVHARAFSSGADTPASAGGESAPLSLRLARTGRTVRIAAGRSLLAAAEAAGAGIPFSCRAGVCRTCRTRLIAGDVDCEAPALDGQDRDGGYIYPCVAWARTDSVIDA